MSEQEYPLPPATFEFLILSLKAQTEMHLGMYHFGEEQDRPAPDFRIARHSIDLLAMLQEKTRGNVTMEEQRLLENALTELRFRFVQALESKEKEAVAPAEPKNEDAEPKAPDAEPKKEEQADA
ncbi:MAG: DUF1844 domain-containing protein [Bryobacteraceae bacterium]